MTLSAKIKIPLPPKSAMTLAIMSLLASIGLAGCSDLSAKAPDTTHSTQSTTMAQNAPVTPSNAMPSNVPPSETQHPETHYLEGQSPAEKDSIWVNVANTMAHMRCH